MKAEIKIEKSAGGAYYFMNGDKLISSLHFIDGKWCGYFHDFISFNTVEEAVAEVEIMIRKQAEEIGFEIEFVMPKHVTELRCGDNVYIQDGERDIANITYVNDHYLMSMNGEVKAFKDKTRAIAYVKKQLGDVEFETIIKL